MMVSVMPSSFLVTQTNHESLALAPGLAFL